jgi:hypothetical protein
MAYRQNVESQYKVKDNIGDNQYHYRQKIIIKISPNKEKVGSFCFCNIAKLFG